MFTQKTLRTNCTENPKNIQSSCWNYFKTTINVKVPTRRSKARPNLLSIFPFSERKGRPVLLGMFKVKILVVGPCQVSFFFFLPDLMNKSICFHRFRTFFSYFCVQNLGLNEFNVNLLSLILWAFTKGYFRIIVYCLQSGKTVISNYLSDATETSGGDYNPTQGVR